MTLYALPALPTTPLAAEIAISSCDLANALPSRAAYLPPAPPDAPLGFSVAAEVGGWVERGGVKGRVAAVLGRGAGGGGAAAGVEEGLQGWHAGEGYGHVDLDVGEEFGAGPGLGEVAAVEGAEVGC